MAACFQVRAAIAAHCHEYKPPATLASGSVVGLPGGNVGGYAQRSGHVLDERRLTVVHNGNVSAADAVVQHVHGCSGGGGDAGVCGAGGARVVYEQNARIFTDCMQWLMKQPRAALAEALRQYDRAAGCANMTDETSLPSRGFVQVGQVATTDC